MARSVVGKRLSLLTDCRPSSIQCRQLSPLGRKCLHACMPSQWRVGHAWLAAQIEGQTETSRKKQEAVGERVRKSNNTQIRTTNGNKKRHTQKAQAGTVPCRAHLLFLLLVGSGLFLLLLLCGLLFLALAAPLLARLSLLLRPQALRLLFLLLLPQQLPAMHVCACVFGGGSV